MNERANGILRDPVRALVEARARGAALIAVWAGACAALFALLLAATAGTEGSAAVALTGAACLLVLLWGARAAAGDGATAGAWLCLALVFSLAIGAHVALLPVKPGRMNGVIAPLMDNMWNYDLLGASAWEEGSWSGVYLFVCALVSRLEVFPQMTALKLFDMVCQCLCACAVCRLALLRGARPRGAVAGMLACVLAPTMLFNAGVWLHCDATFAMFTLWGLYFLLADRPLAGCVLWGLALGTKLQSAFLFPLLIPLFMKGKVDLRHLLALALAFVASQSAILLDGQGFSAMLSRYAGQLQIARETTGLADHAPGVFSLMRIASVREFSGMGLYLGVAAALLVALALLRARGDLPADAWLAAAVLLAAGLPLVLPQMNARSLYLAGMLAFAFAGNGRRFAVCVLLELISLLSYMAGIFGADILPMEALSLLAILAALALLFELLRALRCAREEDDA